MKIQAFLGFFFAILVGSPILLGYAQEELSAIEIGEAQQTTAGFFIALQAGDVRRLKQMLGGKAFQQYQVLLEQNQEYPSFLRRYYRGVTMTMEGMGKKGKDTVVTLRMQFPDGVKNTTLLHMQRTLEGTVKIVAFSE